MHRQLDAAALAAYGWPERLRDEEYLRRLLGVNLARAGKQENGSQSLLHK